MCNAVFPGREHKHFFDRDARLTTDFNCPKNRLTLNSNTEKKNDAKFKLQTAKKIGPQD